MAAPRRGGPLLWRADTKQIARQHWCHEKFQPGQGPVKIFLSFILINVRNLVAVKKLAGAEAARESTSE